MKPWITQAIYVYQLVTICSSGVCQPHFGGLAAAAVTGEGAEAGRQQQEFRRLPAGILWLRCSQQCNCGQNLYSAWRNVKEAVCRQLSTLHCKEDRHAEMVLKQC